MKNKALLVVAIAAFGLLFATSPYIANAASLITGAQIKDNSVTGADIREGTLATVPSAGRLAKLPSGHTESGAFSAAGANSSGTGGWLGFGITYPQVLGAAISDDHIVDTDINPDTTHCPGAGRAARGYLCLYFWDHSNVSAVYGYSNDSNSPYTKSALHGSVGVGLYAPVTGNTPYIDGIWTVTAP